jgi:adenosylcobinamide-GDP ribazoletransferase
LALMTRLPLRGPHGGAARAARGYPLVGVVVGAFGAFGYWLANGLALPPLACAFVALAATILVTGGFHEDGLADVADGFGGGQDRADKLAIMRDSRIGSFGVLALLLGLGLRAAALAALASSAAAAAALIAAHALSRALLPPLMSLLPLARERGLAAATGRPGRRDIWTALALGAAIAWLMEGFGVAMLLLFVAVLAAAAVGLLARAQIGGYTGDVLGAAQQAAETAVLLTVAALA